MLKCLEGEKNEADVSHSGIRHRKSANHGRCKIRGVSGVYRHSIASKTDERMVLHALHVSKSMFKINLGRHTATKETVKMNCVLKAQSTLYSHCLSKIPMF